MSQRATGALTQSALDVVRAQLDAATNSVLDYNQVTLSLSPETSEFVLTAREVPGDGSASNYVGELRRPYEKLELEDLLPEPVFVDMAYPCTFNQLKLYLVEKYNLVIEEQEFAKRTSPKVPLFDGDYLDDALERTLGIVDLVTTSKSGRFKEGARLKVLFAFIGTQRRLSDAYRQTKIPKISDLKTAQNSTAGISLFNASAQDCAAEFFRRQHGVELDTSQIDAIVLPLDYTRVKILFQPKYEISSPWYGAVQLLYDKVDIASVCPDYLQINLPYPTTYQAVRSFLLQSYGLQLEEGEVSAGSFNGPILRGEDVVDVPLKGNAFLDLFIQRSSYKWKGRSRLRVQFLQASTYTVGPHITSSAPDGEEEVGWAYQTVATGGQGPYTFERFGTAPVPMSASGLYSGLPLEGFYIWSTLVRDSQGLVGIKTETAAIGPKPFTGPTYGFTTSDDLGYYVNSATDIPFFPSADEFTVVDP